MATLPQAGSEADIENKDAIDMRVFEAGQPTDVDAKHVEQTESALVGVSLLHAARLFWRPSAVCVIIAFSTVLNGYQASLPGGLLANPGYQKQFGTIIAADGTKALDTSYISTWSFMSYTGQFLGGITGALLSDSFGRRSGMIAFSTAWLIGIIIEMVARNWKVWLVAKLIGGLGSGIAQATSLTYMSEIAPSQLRGYLLSLFGCAYAIGQLLVAIALQIVITTNPNNWLGAIYSEWAIWGAWVLMGIWLPESPWYYARNDQHDKAKTVLLKLHKNIVGYDVEREYSAMSLEIEQEKHQHAADSQVAWKDIFIGSDLKRTIGATLGLTMQIWAGSPVVFNYTTYFFQQAGISQPFQANVIVFVVLIFFTIVSFYVIERVGRRALMLHGGWLSGILNIIVATFGVVKQTTAVQNACLAVICIWVVVYAICFAGTGWVFTGELATPRLRAKTASFVVGVNAAFGALMNGVVPLMLGSDGAGARGWGLKSLYMFGILSALGAITVYWFCPETKGRTFNELDEMYETGIPPRHMQKYMTKIEQSGRKKH